jgi:hypothetical protein
MTTEEHWPTAHAGPQTGGLGRRMRSAMTSRNHAWRWAAVAATAPVLVLAALPAAARPAATSVHTIHLVAHETQRKFFNHGGLGDEEIFRGILHNVTGTNKVGIFAGTLTSVIPGDSLNLATVDLQLPGGQITVQGFFFGTQSRIVHAITGGTGTYRGAGGEFSFTFPSPGVLDMTLTIVQ